MHCGNRSVESEALAAAIKPGPRTIGDINIGTGNFAGCAPSSFRLDAIRASSIRHKTYMNELEGMALHGFLSGPT
jgi:hypothetical protein